jgi:hypothetical protein
MANVLECHRNTVGGWLHRRNKPFPAMVMMWAEKTGVPYEWLCDGKWPGADQSVTNDELRAPERLRQMGATLRQTADQLERLGG